MRKIDKLEKQFDSIDQSKLSAETALVSTYYKDIWNILWIIKWIVFDILKNLFV